MFRFFSSKRVIDNTTVLLNFLNEADEELIKAYETKRVNGFVEYASNSVLRYLTDKINSGESILFGTKTYRIRTWKIISDKGDTYFVRKELRHRHVKLSKSVYVAIGEDLDEYWSIQKDGKKFIIDSIERVC